MYCEDAGRVMASVVLQDDYVAGSPGLREITEVREVNMTE